MKIESTDNKIVKKAVKLKGSASYRQSEKLFLIEGLRLCNDALISGVNIKYALCTNRFIEKNPTLSDSIKESAEEGFFEISDSVEKKLSDTKTPQGIFLICDIKDFSDNTLNGSKYLALENISDPSNLGTIIRTAEAFNLDGLILSDDCCDVYNPKVLRGSMGGTFRLNIIIPNDFYGFLTKSKGAGFKIISTTPKKDACDIKNLANIDKTICLIGNEGNGLTDKAFNLSDECMTIKMNGRGESLNASVAASIIIYEMTR